MAKLVDRKMLPPREKVTVLLVGNHSSGKSSFVNWYIEEHVQRTGVAMETAGFAFVTSGNRRETLTVSNDDDDYDDDDEEEEEEEEEEEKRKGRRAMNHKETNKGEERGKNKEERRSRREKEEREQEDGDNKFGMAVLEEHRTVSANGQGVCPGSLSRHSILFFSSVNTLISCVFPLLHVYSLGLPLQSIFLFIGFLNVTARFPCCACNPCS